MLLQSFSEGPKTMISEDSLKTTSGKIYCLKWPTVKTKTLKMSILHSMEESESKDPQRNNDPVSLYSAILANKEDIHRLQTNSAKLEEKL
jgi:hypothetical protein